MIEDMTPPTPMTVSAMLEVLRRMGAIQAEELSIDKDGLLLVMQVRVDATDVDPNYMPAYFAFITDTLTRALKENAWLRERLAGAREV